MPAALPAYKFSVRSAHFRTVAQNAIERTVNALIAQLVRIRGIFFRVLDIAPDTPTKQDLGARASCPHPKVPSQKYVRNSISTHYELEDYESIYD